MLQKVYPPEEERLESVVRRYQRVAPAVNRFAQSLSGNPHLKVRLGLSSSVSTHEVVCDPRLFQAAYRRKAPVTPEEVALASALHEVIHLVSSDFDEERTYPEHWPVPTTVPDQPVDLLGALELAVGPVGVSLFFALEDARQEVRGLSQYQGASSVLADLYRSAVGTRLSRMEAIAQFGLGCFLLGARYLALEEIVAKVSGPVGLALTDTTDLLAGLPEKRDPWKVAELALELVTIARLHGLVRAAQPQSDQEWQQQQEISEDMLEGLDQVRLVSPSVQDQESYLSTRSHLQQQNNHPFNPNISPASVGNDAATELVVRVSQAETVFLPDGQTGQIVVAEAPQAFSVHASSGRDSLVKQNRIWGLTQRRVSGELFHLFTANQRRGLRSGYDQGDISPYAALFIGAGLYQRLYERREVPNRRSYAVSLLVDGSASMLQPRDGTQIGRLPTWGMSAALLGAWSLAQLCHELQVDFEVALFNRSFIAQPTDTEWSYTRYRRQAIAGLRQHQGSHADNLTNTVNHYLLKSFGQKWRQAEEVVAGIFWTATNHQQAAQLARRNPQESPPVSMFDKAANVDELNLATAARRISRWGAQTRVLVVLADGMTRGRVETLAATARQIEQEGTLVLGIGIGDNTVASAYHRYQVVDQPEQLTRAMVEGTRSALRRGLGEARFNGERNFRPLTW